MSIEQSTAPADVPVTTAEAKLWCRVTATSEDDLFAEMVKAAVQAIEDLTMRQLFTATWQLKLDYIPQCGEILLPRPPLQSVTTFAYNDTAGDSQTLATTVYGVSTDGIAGRVYLKEGQAWPSTQAQADAVTITYVAGYGVAAAVPEKFKIAIKMMVAYWYENREGMGQIPEQVQDFLHCDIVRGVPVDNSGPTL